MSAEPIDAPGLRYVPAAATVAFAARPAAVPGLRDRLLAAGLPADALGPLDAVGLKLEGVEELAGGLVVLPDTLIPRAVVAMTLAKSNDADGLRARLKATAAGPADTYQAAVRGVPVYYRERSARSLVFATDVADLAFEAAPGGRHLPAGVRSTAARVPAGSVAWLATAEQDWPGVPAVALSRKFLGREGSNPLTGVTALWAALPATGDAVLRRQVAGKWE